MEDKKTPMQEAVLTVMKKVPYIQKEMVKGLNYKTTLEKHFIAALHDVMVEQGLSIRPVPGFKLLYNGGYVTSGGKAMVRVIIEAQYVMDHISGESRQLSSLGEASDSSDKAVAKAMTIAYKYALREAFLIETGDDPDVERHEIDNVTNGETAEKPVDKPKMSQEESYKVCVNALKTATTVQRLGVFRNLYRTKRGFNEDQIKILDKIADGREAELISEDGNE